MAQKETKMVEIRGRTEDELTGSLERAREELFRLRMSSVSSRPDNVMALRQKRREVARILTVMSERARGATVVSASPQTKSETSSEASSEE